MSKQEIEFKLESKEITLNEYFELLQILEDAI